MHLHFYIFTSFWILYCTFYSILLYDCAFVTFIIKVYLTWLV